MTTPYRCSTPCDEDCEINGWGCHEAHGEPKRQEHDPAGCEGRALAGSLRQLIDAGWKVRLGRHPVPHDGLEWYYAEPVDRSGASWVFHGVSPGEAIARAREWSEREGATP